MPGVSSSASLRAVTPRRVLILGAAGRDFHNFNVVFRDDPTCIVVGFTAAQIPGITGRRYPSALAGPRYPDGIPIYEESELEALCRGHEVGEVVFAYSDVPHEHVMHLASRALSVGADFVLLGPRRTMLRSSRPVIAVSAVRTGCGKSQIARWLSRRLRERGLRVAVLRHPMPYGDLLRERVQRLASLADLDAACCSAEEREEYEPHIALGNLVFAGVDYADILEAAEREADVVVWDGGNNDFPFVQPDLHVVVVDALRSGQVATHHPGETVARMADIAVINKVDVAADAAVADAIDRLREVNPRTAIVRAASPVQLSDRGPVSGRRALVVEDGPTVTHGGMAYGAGYVAAVAAGAAIVNPRASAVGIIKEIFERYPHIGQVLPLIGYNSTQRQALEATINGADADVVVAATPLDLARFVRLNKPVVRVSYEFAEVGEPRLDALVETFLAKAIHRKGPA